MIAENQKLVSLPHKSSIWTIQELLLSLVVKMRAKCILFLMKINPHSLCKKILMGLNCFKEERKLNLKVTCYVSSYGFVWFASDYFE